MERSIMVHFGVVARSFERLYVYGYDENFLYQAGGVQTLPTTGAMNRSELP